MKTLHVLDRCRPAACAFATACHGLLLALLMWGAPVAMAAPPELNDVILGVRGMGTAPVDFTAEACNLGILELLRWRAGVTQTVQITLETLGGYSATAPYNCPKSAVILEKGLQRHR